MSDLFLDTLIGPPTDAPAVNFGDELMDTQALTTVADAVIVGVPMMDAAEARAVVTRIKTRIDVARGELLELKDREGWKALGYSSWGACAKAEFGGSAATLYRQLEAAEIARNLGDSQFENLPTSQLQAVKDLTPDQARQALDQAREKTNGQPTARDVWAAADQVAQRTPPALAAAGVQLTKHGSWFKAIGHSGVMNGWTSGNAQPWEQTVKIARDAIAMRTAAPPPPLPAAPDLADILLRLDAHGYAKTTTRQKGITTFYSFRDYRGDHEESGGELELAEGELPLWLAELDANAAYAQAKQEKYLSARDRAERLGYDLKRDGGQFVLTPAGQSAPTMRGALDQLIKTIDGYERNAAKKADAVPLPTLADLDSALPKALETAGYFWHSAQPRHFVIAHHDGWTGDAHTPEQALVLAHDREKARASTPTPALNDWWNALRAIERAMQHKKLGDACAATFDLLRLISGATPQTRAAALLIALEREMKDLSTDDQEGLSQAIADLNECEEGTEVNHWLGVGYALLDLETT